MDNYLPDISEHDYRQICDLIKKHIGTTLGDNKHQMLITRLNKRLHHFNFTKISQYIELLNDPRYKSEIPVMIDLVTTHETYFWREKKHFEWLQENVFATYENNSIVRVWSAACSYGHEAYTMAIFLEEARRYINNYSILCSDISQPVLKVAKSAIYSEEEASKIPFQLRKRYLQKGKGPQIGSIRFNSSIREKMSYRIANLSKLPENLGFFDIILLRNVLIYFDDKGKEDVLNGVLSKLKINGFLVLGHSENIMGGHSKLKHFGSSIYQKISN